MARLSTDKKLTTILTIALVVVLVLTLLSFIYINWTEKRNSSDLRNINEQQVLSQELAKNVLATAHGTQSRAWLLENSKRFDDLVTELKANAPTSQANVLDQHERIWQEMLALVETVESNSEQLLKLNELITLSGEKIPELQVETSRIAEMLRQDPAMQNESRLLLVQLQVLERIYRSLGNIFVGDAVTAEAIDSFGRGTQSFRKIIEGLIVGDNNLGIQAVKDTDVRDQVKILLTKYVQFQDLSTSIFEVVPSLLSAQDASKSVADISGRLGDSTKTLIDRYSKSPHQYTIGNLSFGPWLVFVLGSISVVLAILLGSVMLTQSKNREQETFFQSEQNEKAILQLLDEMGHLADGDLTVETTVTENITGAIADSVNYVVEALRNLVMTIRRSADQITLSSGNAQTITKRLNQFSSHQAEQIKLVAKKMGDVKDAMDTMNADAISSVEVANKSKNIASQGGAVVRNTTEVMDRARSHIQDTGKRIKRLGESSQQVSEIIVLIEDIADQTNLLALNASMQAANAGEAGRGFAVVADEVQRLAERSVDATRQVEALVKTIQVDTRDAVVSMETSTASVVEGARLAENAGKALQRIESASNNMADIILKISRSSQAQSKSVSDINQSMNSIHNITNQAFDGVTKVTGSVSSLARLSKRLQDSVAGFKLPAKK